MFGISRYFAGARCGYPHAPENQHADEAACFGDGEIVACVGEMEGLAWGWGIMNDVRGWNVMVRFSVSLLRSWQACGGGVCFFCLFALCLAFGWAGQSHE